MKKILNRTEIRMQKTVICFISVLLICLWSTSLFASWSQEFNENGVYGGKSYKITGIEVFKINGTSDFEGTGMSNFSPGTWTVERPNSDYVVATNIKGIRDFTWLFSFTGTTEDTLELAYLAYTSTGKVFGSYLNFDSGDWSYPTLSNLDELTFNRTTSAVPIPSTVFLFGAGLLGFVGILRNFNVTSS
ncbi:MAG: PEP-CTERM sorting domain-containing protein [Proteobacteria bacterium]|nr:PEP-CTERM sorting domain-containing protein [Pseudomonadota bacterium]